MGVGFTNYKTIKKPKFRHFYSYTGKPTVKRQTLWISRDFRRTLSVGSCLIRHRKN